MTARKPLPEGCDGGVNCPISGHVVMRGGGHWRRTWGHVDLTSGQRKTLRERQRAKGGADRG